MEVDITIPAQSVTIPSQEVSVTVPAAQIVYQNSWLNQTSDISSTAIFTPTGEGTFRATIIVYVIGTGGAAGGSVHTTAFLTLSGNGGVQAETTWGGQFSTGTQSGEAADIIFGNFQNAPIYLSTSTGTSGQGALSYFDVYVTIEQLQ